MTPDDKPMIMAHGQGNAEVVSDGSPSLTCNHEAPILAFSCKDSGADAAENVAPTLRSMNNAESNMNGGGQVAVAFRTSGNCGPFEQGDKTACLNTATDPNQNIIVTTQASVEPMWDHGRFLCVKCKTNFGVNDYDSNTVTCPQCGNTGINTIKDFLQDGGAIDVEAIAFKPSHFTRDKDGAPSEIAPPLSADADKGDQEPLIFQSRIARNGRGQPEEVCPALNGTDAGATSDMRPLVAMSLQTDATPKYGDVAFTLKQPSASGGGLPAATMHGTCVRRLTPTECLRLQGFPDDWLDGLGFSDTIKYRQCGNSVAVPVFEWVARRIRKALVPPSP